MDEPEFWLRLEYRICEEFEGFEDNQLRWYWCDGLLPDRYDQHGVHLHISGRAWIETRNRPGRGQRLDSRHGPWRFTLIARHTAHRDAIDWDGLLPSGRLTGWLTPEPASKTLKIDPASGYND